MYIMCVCLFSALSRRVGALQISIIIYYSNDGDLKIKQKSYTFECIAETTKHTQIKHNKQQKWKTKQTTWAKTGRVGIFII